MKESGKGSEGSSHFDTMDYLDVYLMKGGATDVEIEKFREWCKIICNGGSGKASIRRRRYCCYKLWAKLLRKRCTPYKRDEKFKFNPILKMFIRSLAEGDVADAASPPGAIAVPVHCFVKFVVRRLDEAL